MRPDSVATRPHLYSKENYLDICTASTQFLKLPVQGFFELFNAATFQQHVPVGTLWLGLRKVRCFAVNAQGFFPGFCRPRIRYISLSSESHNRSEEHTSELQSRGHLVCRLLLEKKNK